MMEKSLISRVISLGKQAGSLTVALSLFIVAPRESPSELEPAGDLTCVLDDLFVGLAGLGWNQSFN